jgi:AhpC/TSA family
MRRLNGCGLVPWLALTTALAAQVQDVPGRTKKPAAENTSLGTKDSAASPAERYRDVLKSYEKARDEFLAAYRAAKTDDERSKVITTKQPDSDSYADKMFKIAQDAPKDPVAVEALIWISLNSQGPKSEQAMKILVADHVQNPKVGSLCARMVYDNSRESETFLREVLARNPGHEAKGQACLALGQRLKTKAEREASSRSATSLMKEAETLLDRVAKEFADIKLPRGTTGDVAKNVLNELRHLGIGKTAPDVSGEDIDGKPLKLTDFRGKVVVLDFWGDW